MASFKLSEILTAFNIDKNNYKNELDNVFDGITIDTRTLKPGELYFALKGDRFDGHDFLDQAVEAGAGGVVIAKESQWISSKVSIFQVEDSLIALGELARYHRSKFSIPIIGITGSVGKTSTKDLIATALGQMVLKTQGNYNNEIGLPLTLFQLDSTHHYGVVEMGMRSPGEITYLAEIARPEIGVVTSIAEVHLENMKTLEAIAEAKSELIAALPSKSLAVLNGDDPLVAKMKGIAPDQVLMYGTTKDTDVRGKILSHSREGLVIAYQYLDEPEEEIQVPLYGDYQLSNILAAVAVARFLEISPQKIRENLLCLKPSSMRMESRIIKEVFVLNDAYNANVKSMKGALDAFKEIGQGKRVALLGDMFELGEASAESHEDVVRYALALGFERIILTGKEMTHIGKMINDEALIFPEWREDIPQLLSMELQEGDSLLLKGSRGMQLERILEAWEHL